MRSVRQFRQEGWGDRSVHNGSLWKCEDLSCSIARNHVYFKRSDVMDIGRVDIGGCLKFCWPANLTCSQVSEHNTLKKKKKVDSD